MLQLVDVQYQIYTKPRISLKLSFYIKNEILMHLPVEFRQESFSALFCLAGWVGLTCDWIEYDALVTVLSIQFRRKNVLFRTEKCCMWQIVIPVQIRRQVHILKNARVMPLESGFSGLMVETSKKSKRTHLYHHLREERTVTSVFCFVRLFLL